jgi:hypothetical protein
MIHEPKVAIDFLGHGDHFQPGETLAGQFWIEHLSREDLIAVEISVLWHTDGKGDEDLGVHLFKRLDAAQGDYLDPTVPTRFSTQLPYSPLTYDGVLVKIRWCVRVRAFLAGGKELVRDRNFFLGDVRAPRIASVEESPQLLAY